MSFLKTLIWKLGRIFLAVMGAIRRAFCCRRRHQNESLLPITVGELNSSIQTFHLNRENDLQTWEWTESETAGTVAVDMNQKLTNGSLSPRSSFSEGKTDEEIEDYFKDMVPEFRRPKKYHVQHLDSNMNDHGLSSRLTFDAKTPIGQSSELGTLDENSTSWEDTTALDDVWDPDAAVRDKRKAERERRLAEHQRRKQERETMRSRRDSQTVVSKLS